MNLALIGYGKMGKTIERLALEAGHHISLRFRSVDSSGLQPAHLRDADVALEFTGPESAVRHIKMCFEAGVPVVSGTTGWLDQLADVLDSRERSNGGFFYASNFSIGVNIAFHLNRVLAKIMNHQPDYHPEMTEIHHIHKLDAPSGTAITLAEGVVAEVDRIQSWVSGREGDATTLPIESIREGEVPGIHEVRYVSDIDTITLKHEAHSREGFARGALLAAEWMQGQTGFFGMADLLAF